MEEKILSPKNDYVFRILFGRERSKKILISLLSSIISEKVVDIVLSSPDLEKSYPGGKGGSLDICVTTDQGVQIDVEMQVSFRRAYISRVLFYWARLFSSQLLKREKHKILKKTISITFLYDKAGFFPRFHSIYLPQEKHNDPVHVLTDLQEFHFINMKLIEGLPLWELTDPLKMWTAFLASPDQDRFEELATQEPCIRRAYMELQQLSRSKKVRREAEAREKFLMDQILREGSAREEGEKRGIVIGEERGEKKGIEKGRLEGRIAGRIAGREEGIIETAKAMIRAGVSVETVCKATGLSPEDLI
jgi:predicted transposase/invertase (TIGR01784 family)